jgi:Transcriptional antiterminator
MAKLKQEEMIFQFLSEQCKKQKENNSSIGCTTNDIAEVLNLKRTNVSSTLNKLTRIGKVQKSDGRPVLYKVDDEYSIQSSNKVHDVFEEIIDKGSLDKSVKKAKAAVLYPPKGLHTLLLGPTGVGKTMFAELMYKFAVENNIVAKNASFVTVNCADYTNNPQLILSQLFGYVKGAFTGANKDHVGMVENADGGILFLDEVHRLPPEGQELLFYLIDKGEFSPMGSSEKRKVDILIICATTESKDSALLRTFTRRIPMTIYIPSLKERGLEERFYIIKKFLIEESFRVNKKISIKTEVLKSLLVYECQGNIGQLRSDIKLICANAFLDTISGNRKAIEIEAIHLPYHIRKGGLYLKSNSKDLDELIKGKECFHFYHEVSQEQESETRNNLRESFYDNIERRIKELYAKNYSDEDIEAIMNFEISGYFKSYLNRLDDDIEISKISSKKTIVYAETLLNIAQKELNRSFSNKVFYALCLHFDASIKRLKNNKKIVNHNILKIIENYPKEFEISRTFMKDIEKDLNVFIPLDEIAFVAMFLSTDLMGEKLNYDLPRVIIAMHGKSTASSMADAVNKLLGIDTVLAYDMDLNKQSKICYEELRDLIKKNHSSAGVILLVDMGSLGMFGDLISEELSIRIRVLDFVTTAIALETARNAEIERDIDKICDLIQENIPIYFYGTKQINSINTSKDKVILVTCTTGEGSAIKIKKLIEDNININDKNIDIVTLSISDAENVIKMISKFSEEKKIIAVVGSVNPKIYGIPFIPLSELIILNKYDTLLELINKDAETVSKKTIKYLESIENKILLALRDKIEEFDTLDFAKYFNKFFTNIIKCLSYAIGEEEYLSLIFHTAATTSALICGKKCKEFKGKERILIDYSKEIRVIKESLFAIEEKYNVNFKEDEICYILSIMKKDIAYRKTDRI